MKTATSGCALLSLLDLIRDNRLDVVSINIMFRNFSPAGSVVSTFSAVFYFEFILIYF